MLFRTRTNSFILLSCCINTFMSLNYHVYTNWLHPADLLHGFMPLPRSRVQEEIELFCNGAKNIAVYPVEALVINL